MSRPLLTSSIIDLEKLFEASQNDPQILLLLEQELRNRKTKRAVLLLANVIRYRQHARTQDEQARAEAEQRRRQNQERTKTSTHSTNEQLRIDMRQRLAQPNGWRSVLELSGAVDLAAARIAYRKMAMRMHPDRGGDPELMTLLNQAMETARKDLGF